MKKEELSYNVVAKPTSTRTLTKITRPTLGAAACTVNMPLLVYYLIYIQLLFTTV